VRRAGVGLVACLLVFHPSQAIAQRPTGHSVAAILLDGGEHQDAEQRRPSSRWLRPVASAVLPGAGQLLGGQDRGVLYLAAEVVLVATYFGARSEGRRERNRFRDLAFTVARAPFEPMLRDTVFEYFEQLEKFNESGPLDVDPGPGFVPPTDERTYNGQIWALARQTFFADPDDPPDPESEEFLRALEFYRSRAVGPNFFWSWRDAGLEQDLYRQSIRQSDAAFRRATQRLGLILVNHLLSTVDAFISERLSRRRRPTRVQALIWSLPGGADGIGAGVVIDVAF
jgi:hypothetical protein